MIKLNFNLFLFFFCFYFNESTRIGGGVVDVFIGVKTSNGIVLTLVADVICNVD